MKESREGLSRRDLLKGAGALGAMAAMPALFASIAEARSCKGERCIQWHGTPSPAPRSDPTEEARFKEDMNRLVSKHEDVKELLAEILSAHGIDASRYSIIMSPPGRAIQFEVSENNKAVGVFSISTMQLQIAYGIRSDDPQLINKKGFQVLFFRHLQELKLPTK